MNTLLMMVLFFVVSLFLNVGHVQAVFTFNSDEVTNLENYYACYFNKYFKLSLDDNRYEADRDLFIEAKIEVHLKYEERAPTPACVGWMCDEKMIWDWRRKDKLETWTYFAEPGDKILSWGDCFKDEEINFRDKNYTFSDAGEDHFVLIDIS